MMFFSFGVVFGCLLSDQSAPAICWIVIGLYRILGSVWMPLESMQTLLNICKAFPLYRAITASKKALWCRWDHVLLLFLITVAFAVVLFVLAVICFHYALKHDND